MLLALTIAFPVRAEDRTAALQAHAGGTLHLLAQTAAGSIDPQVNYTGQYWQLFVMAYDGLVAMRKVAGEAGNGVVADLADAVPEPQEGGTTYVFHLRPGLRFSDGASVRPSDAVASFRRLFKVASPTAGTFYSGIVGAADCLAQPADCTLPGAIADDAAGIVTLRLERPDPEFLLKLTLPHASVLPAGAPGHDVGNAPVAGTGPYAITEYAAASHIRLERNRFFTEWSAEAQPAGYPDAIEERFGLAGEAEVTQVENGQADWMFEPPPADRLAELGSRYADQVHLDPALAIWLLPMNVHERPFDDVRVRRAVNMAIDRAAVVKLFGGPRLAAASCQVLPPRILGYERYCPWPIPDLDAARALVVASGTMGATVTLVIDTSPLSRAIGTYVASVLRDLGYDARLRSLSANVQFTYIQNTDNHVQISLTTWYSDYPSAYDFLPTLFGCSAIHPGTDSSINISGFCDPALDAQMQAALAEPDPARQAQMWAAVDRAVTDQAPSAVLFNPVYIDVTARRVEHFIYHDQFHWLSDQSWVR